VECLSHVLNTNHKRQLLIPIRDSYIKPSDLSKFNQLALEYGLATPIKKKKSDSKDGVKKIEIKRSPDGEWGFNIRGGSEHGIGIFVSSVEPGSNASKSGLKAGDQIKKANNLNCESVTHHEAVSVSASPCIVTIQ
jgi:C-terminal processing protease CtpA/Prc